MTHRIQVPDGAPDVIAAINDPYGNSLTGYSYLSGTLWRDYLYASCYAFLKQGREVALQIRVPTSVTSPRWSDWTYLSRGSTHIKIPWYSLPSEERKASYIVGANEYLRFILNREISPWRAAIPKDMTIYEDEKNNNNIYGVHFKGMKVNRALFHNLCIAIRMSWEQQHIVMYWQYLKDLTSDPVAALYYAMATDRMNKEVCGLRMLHHTWIPMNAMGTTPMSLLQFRNPDLSSLSRALFTSNCKSFTIYSNHVWKQNIPPNTCRILEEFAGINGCQFSKANRYRSYHQIPAVLFDAYLPEAIKIREEIERLALKKGE